jgi:hypothetical protein
VGHFDVRVTVQAHGPLMDGRASGIVRDWLDGVKKDIAQEGLNRLRSFVMDKTGRATGRYQSEIVTSTLNYNDLKISNPSESGYAYGPWLEGFSSRNRSTRFKGYHLWRQAAQKLQDDAPGIAERKLPELIQKLGGG